MLNGRKQVTPTSERGRAGSGDRRSNNGATKEMFRLAVVQHGDYAEGLRVLETDAPEPYFGMKRSVAVLERFLQGTTYRVISVDAPRYRISREKGDLIGLHRPDWPKLSKVWWSWNVYREVRRFRPTHLLMRTGGILAWPVVAYAVKRNVNTLVLMAGYLQAQGWRGRWLQRQLVRVLNHPSVYRVTNHRRPATLSTIAAGVNPAKVLAWDFEGIPRPDQYRVKSLSPGRPLNILFAGVIKEGKGIGDLLAAAEILRSNGVPVRLTVCGDGPVLPKLKRDTAHLPPGQLELLGRVGNEEVHRRMREATFVCVPSRRDSSEGLPFVVTEALATRTPLLVSDHPSITHLLVDGEGVRIFESGHPRSLAQKVADIANDAEAYQRLSESTEKAFSRLDADITFAPLLERWREQWKCADDRNPFDCNESCRTGLPVRP